MPRLYHTKSKNGCTRCRARRVKCDEARPSCGGCTKHQVECTYNRIAGVSSTLSAPVRTPGSQLLSTPSPDYRSISPNQTPTENPQRRLLELRLLHVYMAEICPQNPGTHIPALQALWSKEVPKLALQNEILLNAIFALSCFYLSTEGNDPDPELQIARAGYLGAAIEAHKQNLSNLTKDNADVACFVSSLLAIDTFANLRVRSLEPYAPPFHWLQMTRGLGGVFREATALLRNDPNAKMLPIVADRAYANPDLVFHKSHLKGLENLVTFHNDEIQDEIDYEAYEKAACFIGSVIRARKDGEHPKMICRRLHSYWVLAPARYIELLQLLKPRALVILAYFFGLASWVDNIWWIGPSPGREIRAIREFLGREWQDDLWWAVDQLTKRNYLGPDNYGESPSTGDTNVNC